MSSLQLDRLHQRAVSRRIPRSEADPLLVCRVERDLETMPPKWRELGGRDNTPAGRAAIAPDHFDELERKGPLDFGDDGPLRAAALDAERWNQHLSRGREVVPTMDRVDERAHVVHGRQLVQP